MYTWPISGVSRMSIWYDWTEVNNDEPEDLPPPCIGVCGMHEHAMSAFLRIATGELCIVYSGLRIFIHDGGFPIGTGSSDIAFSGLSAPLNSLSKLKSGSNTRAT